MSVTGETVDDEESEGEEETGDRGVGNLQGPAQARHGVGGDVAAAPGEVSQQEPQPGQPCQASRQQLGRKL